MIASAASPDTTCSRQSQLVTFCLGDEEFGVDIMSVQEIIREPTLSRIPMVPSYVEGIANLRGTLLPILDARSRFGIERQQDTESTRVVVVDIAGNKIGLRVDRVNQVTRIASDAIERPPAMMRCGVSSEYVHGLVNLEKEKRIIIALNPAAVCKLGTDNVRSGDSPAQERLGHGRAEENGSVGTGPAPLRIVAFQLGKEEYALPMDCVCEVLRAQRPSEVPNAHESLLGVLTVRGDIMPVIDLRRSLGMQTLAIELSTSVRRVRQGYDEWLKTLERQILEGSHAIVEAAAPELLQNWLSHFGTANEGLIEISGRIQTANDNAIHSFRRLLDSAELESRKDQLQQGVRPCALEALRLLDSFETQLFDHAIEDQQLVVIQSEGTRLALMVDRVRAVLSVPASDMVPAPRTGSMNESIRFQGVARLDQGRRLILLLEPHHLVRPDWLEQAGILKSARVEDSISPGQPSHYLPSHQIREQAQERLFVVFGLDDCEYGVPIEQVREIGRYSKPTLVPTCASYVEGLTNLRGEVVSVVNARKRLALPEKEPNESARMIIVDVDGQKTGLLVDSIREVLHLQRTDVTSHSEIISKEISQDYVLGIGCAGGTDRMVVLLDAARIVRADA